MSLVRAVAFGLAGIETALSAVIAVVAARRWSRFDSGARWTAVGNGINLASYAITIPLVLTNRSTRLVNEAPVLLTTIAMLTAFARWQPRPSQRRFVLATIPLSAVLWGVGQVVQGGRAEFSTISVPISSAFLAAAAGFTIITGVQATMERWTDQIWFWTASGYLLTSGSQVLFDPAAAILQSYRPDLGLAIYLLSLMFNIVGYALVLRGFLLAGKALALTPRSAEPVTTLTVGSSGTWAVREL